MGDCALVSWCTPITAAAAVMAVDILLLSTMHWSLVMSNVVILLLLLVHAG